jgi:hypothetical protein
MNHHISGRRSQSRHWLPAVVLTLVGLFQSGAAQEPMREEIVVGFEIPRLLKQDIFVQYDGETVYVPLIEVFTLLDYSVKADLANERIGGSLAVQSEKFLIDLTRFRVKAPGVDRELLRSDYHYDGRDLYLRVDLYGELFGLRMKFDFSMLRVLLPLNDDFPAYQKLERQKARRQLVQKQAALRDVMTLKRSRDYFAGGAADWRLSTTPFGTGAQYFDLDLGGVLLGGDFTASGGGSTRTGFDTDRLNYLWHYCFDNNKYVTQVDLGRLYTTGALARALTGLRATNRPQIRRKYFQTVQVAGQPGVGWEAELYVDGKLTDFQNTDAAGRYDFNVDVYYGASDVEIKLYGPNGEIETEEQHFRIPFNLLPKDEVEYSAAIGQGQGEFSGRTFAQAGASYGLFSRLTTGLDVDIPVTPLENERPMYAFEATFQPATNFALAGSMSPDNRLEFDANYVWPSVITFGAHASSYFENAVMNPMRQQYRWQVSLSSPLRIRGLYLGLRYNISQDQYEGFGSTNMTYGFNTSFKPVHLNYVGQWQQRSDALGQVLSSVLTSKLMGSIEVHRRFRPQFRIDYDHTAGEITRYGISLAKRLWRSSQMTLSYENAPVSGASSFLVTLHFFTNFLDFSSRTQVSGGRTTMTQMQQGSIRFDQNNHRFLFDRKRSVGYGTAVVTPFLDENYNGVRESTEESVPGLKAKVTGVSGRPRGGDRTYYYDRLRPYDEYLVQIDPYSLDDPTLKPSNENFRVTLNPSVVTQIEVPIVMASEISGSVKRQVGEGTAGVGGIKVILFNVSKDIITEVTTFNDGEYYFLGLLPGSYRAYLDPEQLKRGGYATQPPAIEFDVKPVMGGQTIENISFLMVPAVETTVGGSTN